MTYDRLSQALTNTRYWKLRLTGLFVLLVMIFSTPYINYLPDLFTQAYWTTVMKQVNAPTIYQPEGRGKNVLTHESKKTFRLTVPMIARALHLNGWGIYILQFLLGIALVYSMLDYCDRTFHDKTVAFWTVLAATSVYFGTACFTDVYSYFSGWAFSFLFAAIRFRQWWLVCLMCLLAAWTDERGALAVLYVMLYWQYERWSGGSIWKALRPTAQTLAAAGALVFYFGGRFYLQHLGYYVGMHPLAPYFYDNLEVAPFGVWTFFEGLWVLIAYKYYLLFRNKRYDWAALNFLLLAGMVLSSLIIRDVTRSGSFIFLEAFVSALMIYREGGLGVLKRYMFFSAVVCVLFPPYYVITDSGPIILQRNVLWFGVKYVFQRVFM